MDQSLDVNRGDYYMDVREFKGGGVEVVVKTIRPMHDGAIRSVADPLSYVNACVAMGESSNTSTVSRYVDPEASEPDDFQKTENHQRAVRRAKQNIRWCVRELEADRLLTLTYRECMTDRQRLIRDVKEFVRLVRKGWGGQSGSPNWRYVAVTELQERGAYHVHFAVAGWQRISFLRSCWGKALGGSGYEKGSETLGNVDVTSPRKARWGTQVREWKSSKLAAYITKYLAKTFAEETTEKRRYWHSKDLRAPIKERFLLGATSMVSAITEAMNVLFFNYGLAIDFSRSWCSPSGDSIWLSLGET